VSRSFKKTPIIGLCGVSDKQDKRIANRKTRRAQNIAVKSDKDVIPVQRECSDVWDMTKDGKCWVGFDNPKWLRK